jgi:hypothetical protein
MQGTRQHVVDILRMTGLRELGRGGPPGATRPGRVQPRGALSRPKRHHQRRADQPPARKPVTREGSARASVSRPGGGQPRSRATIRTKQPARSLPPRWPRPNITSRTLVAERGDGIDVMIAHKIYHLDGTVCHEAASCFGSEHTRFPPLCYGTLAEIAGRAVTCDLPMGHLELHLHVETGWQY